MSEKIKIEQLALRDYRAVWNYQKERQRSLIDGSEDQVLLVCEHDPVITIGKSGKNENLLIDKEALRQKGIEVFEVERGGDVTYHGPGQLVFYPILNLNNFRRDVDWYMRTLEEIVISSLKELGVASMRFPGRTGVWTEHADDGRFRGERKIASIGVRLSRWCSMHGFAVNILNCSEGFGYIHPCGFTDIRVTSVEEERRIRNALMSSPEELMAQSKKILIEKFISTFGV